MARPMVTFTSLVGARRKSTRPTTGIRPIQFENRISRKNVTKMGTYGLEARPPIDVAKPSIDSYAHSPKFWRRPGMPAPPRLVRKMVISRPIETIHSVRIVEVMLGSKVIVRPGAKAGALGG